MPMHQMTDDHILNAYALLKETVEAVNHIHREEYEKLLAQGVAPPEPIRQEAHDLIGWRLFEILPVGLLVSPFKAGAVLSEISEAAVCQVWPDHEAPDWNCSPGCGWHALYDRDDSQIKSRVQGEPQLRPPEGQRLLAVVQVSAVGKTVLGTKGFRSRQIRLEEIHVPPDTTGFVCQKLGETYTIPVYRYEIIRRPEEEDPWTSALRKSSSLLSHRSASASPPPDGILPLDEFLKRLMGDFPLVPPPSLSSDRRLSDIHLIGRAEYDRILREKQDALREAMGKCAFCENPGLHSHTIVEKKHDA